jgi:hypothetical protein
MEGEIKWTILVNFPSQKHFTFKSLPLNIQLHHFTVPVSHWLADLLSHSYIFTVYIPRLFFYPIDGSSMCLRNFGTFLPDYTATCQKTVILIFGPVRNATLMKSKSSLFFGLTSYRGQTDMAKEWRAKLHEESISILETSSCIHRRAFRLHTVSTSQNNIGRTVILAFVFMGMNLVSHIKERT